MTVSEIERKLALLQHDCQSLASLDGIEKGERRAVQAIVSQIANIRHELTAALSGQVVGWRTDFANAPSPCLGWCKPPSGDVVRVVYRHEWRGIPHWSSHGSEITVVGWQPLPAIELAAPASTSGEVGK